MTVEANDERWDIFLDAYTRLLDRHTQLIELTEDILHRVSKWSDQPGDEGWFEQLETIKDSEKWQESQQQPH